MSQTLKDMRVVLRSCPLLQAKRRQGYPTHLSLEMLIPSLTAIAALYKESLMYRAVIEEGKRMQSKLKAHLYSFKSGYHSVILKGIMPKMKTTRKILQHHWLRRFLYATRQRGSTHTNACFKIVEELSGTQSSSFQQAATIVL